MASDDEMCPYPSDDEVEENDDCEYRDDADDEGVEADDAAFGSADVERNGDGHDAQVLSETEILERQSRAVQELVNILAITPEQASILLRAYKWHVSHATDEWFSNEEKVRERLGLLEGASSTRVGQSGAGEGPADKVTCGICFDDFDKGETSAPPCEHSYCNLCWTNYFNVAISEGQGCLSLRCPKPDCKMAVGDTMILRLASHSYKEQFKKFLLRSYVDSSTNVRWCPAPGCSFAVALDSWRAGPAAMAASSSRGPRMSDSCMSANVECRCSHWFCWNCLEEPHRPVECDVVKKWLIKNSAESENMNWILANSKACPKCKRPIEKNHGCMHMTCSAPCKYEFCWLCLGDWKAHSDATGGFYACNRYEDAKKKGDLTEEDQRKERARQCLERYLHYYERWATNETSRKKAMDSLNETKDLQADVLRELMGLPAAEMSFLAEAWQQVVECRRVLKWTYAYGFYLEGEEGQAQRRRNLFEYLQGQADAALGGLHKCAEKDVERFLPKCIPSIEEACMQPWRAPSREEFLEFKSDLSRRTAVTKNFFDNLVKALETGLADVTDQPAIAGAGSAKGKGKGKERRKKRQRFGPGKGGEEGEDWKDETSGMATIDSGEEDLESGEEGETKEVVGGPSSSRPGGSSEEPEYWSCSHCTYANRTAGPSNCAICRLPRGST